DPILGPKKPLEEILPDGGDIGPRVGVGPEGELGGLDASDTAAQYRYGQSARRVTISNRVCLFSPRFVVLRAAFMPAGEAAVLVPSRAIMALGQATLLGREHIDETWNAVAVRGAHSKLGVRGIQSRLGVAMLDTRIGVAVTGSVEGVALRGTVVEVESAT